MRTILYTARGLAAVWAAFWIWFGLASGIAEKLDFTGILVHTAVPGLLFLLIAAVAWESELTGGILLVVMGAAVGITYPILFHNKPLAMQIPTVLSLALPALVAGVLFLVHGRISRAARGAGK